MLSELDIKRIYWASRRGMLELDLILVPFFEQCFRDLAAADQQRYIDLMECEDTELFAWFLGRQSPEDAELKSIVDRILSFTRKD